MSTETFKLNEAQQQAVDIVDGPALVVAGAGTGKTKVIVERIAKLIESGIDKHNILALTFTEKAAQEMLDRVGEHLENSYGAEMNIFTFNGFGQLLLQEFAIEIGLSPNLNLIGDIGKVVLLRENLDDLELEYFSPVSNPDGQLNEIANYFSRLKQQLIRPDDYKKYAEQLPGTDEIEKLEKQRHQELARAFEHYQRIALSKNIIDYDDQLYLLVDMLERRPNVLDKLQQRYTHILVDEFQDTNPMQSRLLDLLASKNHNLMAVGDDDQSIYGWRGATLANILDFNKRYTNTYEVTLIENFRSTQSILDMSYGLIQNNNPDRLEHINKLDKKLIAHRGSGEVPSLKKFSTIDIELDWVARDIKRHIDEGVEPGSIAVLARRSHGVLRAHLALDLHAIEHTVVGVSSDLYDQPIVANMIEALKTVNDPLDNSALHHTLGSALFNIEPQALGALSAIARKRNQTLEQAAEPDQDEAIHAAIGIIKEWRSHANDTSVGRLAYKIIEETGLKDSLLSKADESEEGALLAQSLFQWFATLRSFEQVSDVSSVLSYLDNIEALKAEGETVDDGSAAINTDTPVIMTVHKSKGLEWDIVYIIDCTEGSFPLKKRGVSLQVPEELSKTSDADDHYNEERRLMYVASTRARNQLTLTYSDSHTGTTKRKPSRFLEEMFHDVTESQPTSLLAQSNLNLFDVAPSQTKKLSLPGSMLSGENVSLTASQANDFLRCPLDFKYRHILGVPPEPSPHATVGTIFHSYMQRINDAKLHGHEMPELESLLNDLEHAWPHEGYLSAKQRSRALKLGLNALKETYERVVNEPVPVASEEPFRVHIKDSKMILKGRIDVVMPAEGGVEIRDYKTSTTATTPEKAKKSAQASKQLEMYALAWRATHDETPVLVSLDFVQTNQIGSVKKQSKTLDNLEIKLAQMAEDILAGNFQPGYNHDYCRHPSNEA